MVLGPEFGPLAALAVAAVRRDGPLARTAGLTLSGVAFIYQVEPFSLVVALLAGVAGTVAPMAGEGTGVLVGVFISVTTVPAAGFAAVAVVLADWGRATSSLLQLVVNVAGIVFAGVVVLLLARAARRRGLRESLPASRADR